jgi:hypothetical protein
MAGKKGRKKGKKKMKNVVKTFERKAHKIVHGNKRPLKLLKWAAGRMRANLPKLEKIIETREARGER